MRRSISRTPLDPRRGQVDTGLPVDDRRVRLELSQVILPEVIQAPTTNSARSIASANCRATIPPGTLSPSDESVAPIPDPACPLTEGAAAWVLVEDAALPPC